MSTLTSMQLRTAIASANDIDDMRMLHFAQDPAVAMTRELVVGSSSIEAACCVDVPPGLPRQVSYGPSDFADSVPRDAEAGFGQHNASFATDRSCRAAGMEDASMALRRAAVERRRLHVAIQTGAKRDVLERILRHDPHSASRSVPIVRSTAVWCPTKQRHVQRHVREMYSFPLHLAIAKEASTGAIELLIDADPSVLVVRDGPHHDTPLLAVLRTSPTRLDVVDAIIVTQPFCASIKDRMGNTPLHVACQNGATLDVVKHLTILYPEALSMTNLRGKLPLDLAGARVRDAGDILEYVGRECSGGERR
jgi:Ankyrin repeats (many copies)